MSGHEDCRKFFERLSELIDGELDEITAEKIETHIQDCSECVACYRTFRKSVELFKQLGPDPAPPDFLAQLKDFIRDRTG